MSFTISEQFLAKLNEHVISIPYKYAQPIIDAFNEELKDQVSEKAQRQNSYARNEHPSNAENEAKLKAVPSLPKEVV